MNIFEAIEVLKSNKSGKVYRASTARMDAEDRFLAGTPYNTTEFGFISVPALLVDDILSNEWKVFYEKAEKVFIKK